MATSSNRIFSNVSPNPVNSDGTREGYVLMPKAKYKLDDILAEVGGRGMAKANRFEVFITAPPCLYDYTVNETISQQNTGGRYRTQNMINHDGVAKRLSVFCESASLPPTRIITTRQQIFGPPSFHPIGADYGGDNLSLTFALDKWYTMKEFFDIWVDSIVGRNNGLVSYSSDYLSQGMTISQLDEEDRTHYTAVFEDVFPIAVNPIQLDSSMSNTVSKMSVTFCYRRWRNISMTVNDRPVTQRAETVRTGFNDRRQPSNKIGAVAGSGYKFPGL